MTILRMFTIWLAVAVLAVPTAARADCAVSVSTTNFGTYIASVSSTGSTPLTINCTSGTAYDIGLNLGTGAGAAGNARAMTGPGSAVLTYGLFANASHSINWGNSPGVDTVNGSGTGENQAIAIYPEIAAGQLVAPGTYTDTISVFVTGGSSASTTMSVIAIVQASCTLSATPLAFGLYSGAVLDTVSSLTVTCTNTTAWSIGLSAGTASGATVSSRAMPGTGGTPLAYALYRDAAHSINWGTTVGTDTLAGTGSGGDQQVPVYGEIGAGQYVTPGAYADTVIATVTY